MSSSAPSLVSGSQHTITWDLESKSKETSLSDFVSKCLEDPTDVTELVLETTLEKNFTLQDARALNQQIASYGKIERVVIKGFLLKSRVFDELKLSKKQIDARETYNPPLYWGASGIGIGLTLIVGAIAFGVLIGGAAIGPVLGNYYLAASMGGQAYWVLCYQSLFMAPLVVSAGGFLASATPTVIIGYSLEFGAPMIEKKFGICDKADRLAKYLLCNKTFISENQNSSSV